MLLAHPTSDAKEKVNKIGRMKFNSLFVDSSVTSRSCSKTALTGKAKKKSQDKNQSRWQEEQSNSLAKWDNLSQVDPDCVSLKIAEMKK